MYTGRGIYGRKKAVKSTKGTLTIRFVICIIIFLFTAVCKFAFPQKTEKLNNRIIQAISGNVDYKAAVEVLGEAVEGKRSFSEALGDACTYAFVISGESVKAFNNDDKNENNVQKKKDTDVSTANIGNIADTDNIDDINSNVENVGDSNITEINGRQEETVIQTNVTDFKEKQNRFEGYDMPSDVSYDYTELDFEYDFPTIGTLSSSFGYRNHPSDNQVRFHYGTDIAAREGTNITAFADGTVFAVGESTTYGNYVIIEHEGDVKTMYAHLSNISISDGSTVEKGDKIGEMGHTGNATSDCLHFELIIDGTYVNPEYYLRWE